MKMKCDAMEYLQMAMKTVGYQKEVLTNIVSLLS